MSVIENLVYVLYFVFVVTYIGFGIVSTDTSSDTHTLLAIVSFMCLLCLTAIFIYVQFNVLYPSRTLTLACFGTAASAGILWMLTNRYYWEYVLVVSLHFTWLSLSYVCNSSHKRSAYMVNTAVCVNPSVNKPGSAGGPAAAGLRL